MLDNNNFSKQYRLLNKAQFQRVFSQRKKLFSSYFILYHCGNDLDHARIGLVTSKRNAKHAVRRNNIRRQVREVFRQHSLKSCPKDIIVIAKQTAAAACNEEIRRCLEKLFKQLLEGRRKP
ncbi:MAG: ribonuclease P protein component [Gammaproteobacteria bacterium]|nr:ribonuclease P protein component [Gammaproteobacteria bacterium]